MKIAFAYIAIGWMCWSTDNVCNAQTPPSNLSPDLQEVVKLSQSHMGDDVIVNYIKNSGKTYNLSTNDIIFLNDQGLSQDVISALQTVSYANPNPPAEPEINFSYFHDQLAPFGNWVNVGGTMYWHPDQAIAANTDWRPYYDMGQWVLTDNGLFWKSDYPWGDIPFHYGRWVLDPVLGWLWAPDYTWGPAWVFWRQDEADGAIGWAPLPVGAVFVGGVFMFNGVREGVDFDFGLGEACFTFVGYDHFNEDFFRLRGHEWPYHIGREMRHRIYGRSVIRNDFRQDGQGRFLNNGIGRDLIEQLTHVEHSSFEERPPAVDRKAPEEARNYRNEQPGKQADNALIGTFSKAMSRGQHTGEFASLGGGFGAFSGALIGNMIDQEQRQRLQQQSPQTWNKLQNNDAVYANSPPPSTPAAVASPTPSTSSEATAPAQAASPTPAATAPRTQPITVDDIKALTAAGVKPDVITKEIDISQSKFSPQDIASAQQANPPIDPAVIEYMKSPTESPFAAIGRKPLVPATINKVFRPPLPKSNK